MTDPDGDVRDLFLLPPGVVWLNTAFMGPLPRVAVEAGWSALDRKSRPWTVVHDDFFVPGEMYRSLVADLLGADADGVAITPSVSFGLSTFAAQLPLRADQVVLVPGGEFPSNLLPWTAAAARAGATVERVEPGPDGDHAAALLAAIAAHGDRVALVATPPCHWTDGTAIDLVAVGAATRGVGAALAVDVCQTLGAVPFDVAAVQPDVVAGATYKWLLGPYGMGFAWFAPRWRDGAPLDHPWSNQAGAEDLTALGSLGGEHRAGARRYDVGEAAQHQLMAVALASLRLVAGWDPARTAAHAAQLTTRIAEGATALGLTAPDARLRSPHLIGLGLAGTGRDPAAVAAHLADDRVHVSVRGTSLRVSAHRLNTDDDVDRLLASLAASVGANP